jgi:hypothetical protein
MNLDNRENYLKEKRLLKRMSLSNLQRLVGELHNIRYIDHDVEVHAYHRLASSVLLERSNSGKSLIFHLKNFIGLMLLVCKTFLIFKV